MTSAADAIVQALPTTLRPAAAQLRQLVREVAPDLEEGVKWNAPSYALAGRDLLTLNFGKRGELRLVLHRGARAEGAPPPPFTDRHALARWPSPDRGVVDIQAGFDLDPTSPLGDLIRDWIAANR